MLAGVHIYAPYQTIKVPPLSRAPAPDAPSSGKRKAPVGHKQNGNRVQIVLCTVEKKIWDSTTVESRGNVSHALLPLLVESSKGPDTRVGEHANSPSREVAYLLSGDFCTPTGFISPDDLHIMSGALVAMSASSLSLTSAPTAMLSPTLRRAGPVSMGFGPSQKELSDDPPISEVLAKCKVEQRERLAMQALASSNAAFVPGGRELAMSLPGVGPFGYFDPWNLTPESQRDVVLWREAELMHCRVSMLAVVGFVFGERAWTPFMPSMEAPLAINQFTQLSPELLVTFVGLVALVENYRTNRCASAALPFPSALFRPLGLPWLAPTVLLVSTRHTPRG